MSNYFDPPKCRKCGRTICPNTWSCSNPKCVVNKPKPVAQETERGR